MIYRTLNSNTDLSIVKDVLFPILRQLIIVYLIIYVLTKINAPEKQQNIIYMIHTDSRSVRYG